MERGRNTLSGSVPRPHTSVGNDTSQNKCIKLYGIPKGEKQFNDIRSARKFEV